VDERSERERGWSAQATRDDRQGGEEGKLTRVCPSSSWVPSGLRTTVSQPRASSSETTDQASGDDREMISQAGDSASWDLGGGSGSLKSVISNTCFLHRQHQPSALNVPADCRNIYMRTCRQHLLRRTGEGGGKSELGRLAWCSLGRDPIRAFTDGHGEDEQRTGMATAFASLSTKSSVWSVTY
jgi:hypothetical protein